MLYRKRACTATHCRPVQWRPIPDNSFGCSDAGSGLQAPLEDDLMSRFSPGMRIDRLRGAARSQLGRRVRRPRTALLGVESLEHRTLLTTFPVTVGNNFFSPSTVSI